MAEPIPMRLNTRWHPLIQTHGYPGSRLNQPIVSICHRLAALQFQDMWIPREVKQNLLQLHLHVRRVRHTHLMCCGLQARNDQHWPNQVTCCNLQAARHVLNLSKISSVSWSLLLASKSKRLVLKAAKCSQRFVPEYDVNLAGIKKVMTAIVRAHCLEPTNMQKNAARAGASKASIQSPFPLCMPNSFSRQLASLSRNLQG